jgi:hypothetical protein
MIKPSQLTTYDRAASDLDKALTVFASLNVARLDAEDLAELNDVHTRLVQLRSRLFSKAYECFLNERGIAESDGEIYGDR